MDDFTHWLEQELVAAARRRSSARRSLLGRRGWIPWSRLNAGVIVPFVAVAVAVIVAALALTGVHHRPPSGPAPAAGPPSPAPPLPSSPTRTQFREERYLEAAWQATVRRDPACATVSTNMRGAPTVSQGAPAPQLLSLLGVLRRPATPQDRLPARITYHPYRRDPTGTLPPVKGIYVRYIRYSRHRDGANYYLVPAANVTQLIPIPRRCYAEQRRALHQILPRVAPRLRAGVLALEPRFLAQIYDNTQPQPGVCLLGLNDTGNGDGGCGLAATVSRLQQGRLIESGAPGGVPVVDGLAPDGVRSVTLYYPGRYPGHPLTVLVINNVFVLHDPRDRLPNNGFPSRMQWRAPGGRIVKTIVLQG